jgi:hypothetical protein
MHKKWKTGDYVLLLVKIIIGLMSNKRTYGTIMNRLGLLLLIPFTAHTIIAHANTISTPGKAIVIGSADGTVIKLVCYYKDMAYSVGAILQVGEHYLICDKEKAHEQNGPLKWYSLDDETRKQNNNPTYKIE